MVLASLFADVDEDADGEINEEELRKLLTEMAKNEHVEWKSLNADFNVAFNLLDTDGDGKIDLDNFCEWLSEPEKKKRKVRRRRAKAVVEKRLNGKRKRERERQTEGYMRPQPHLNSHIHPN